MRARGNRRIGSEQVVTPIDSAPARPHAPKKLSWLSGAGASHALWARIALGRERCKACTLGFPRKGLKGNVVKG